MPLVTGTNIRILKVLWKLVIWKIVISLDIEWVFWVLITVLLDIWILFGQKLPKTRYSSIQNPANLKTVYPISDLFETTWCYNRNFFPNDYFGIEWNLLRCSKKLKLSRNFPEIMYELGLTSLAVKNKLNKNRKLRPNILWFVTRPLLKIMYLPLQK